jgi:chemotaxis family two-component system response regulator Rcp1
MSDHVYRVFIVEDNPGDIWLIQEALRRQGITLELLHYSAADTAIRAMDELKDGDLPHLFLLDYNVPRGSGREILEAAMHNRVLDGVPKAILTSSMASRDRDEALRLGARCFIIKPGNLDDFLEQVGGTIASLLREQAAARVGA